MLGAPAPAWSISGNGARDATGFMGLVILTMVRTALRPARLPFPLTRPSHGRPAPDAVPIVMLMSFPIGAVLAYQGSEQRLVRFASIFTVDLIGISFLREIGIPLTAIRRRPVGRLRADRLDEDARGRSTRCSASASIRWRC